MSEIDKWDKLHNNYKQQSWVEKPNIFAKEVLEYFPSKGRVLCLGDGQGQDGRFFASKGYTVTSTDISEIALKENRSKVKEANLANIEIKKVDLRNKLPFKEDSFDVVYAHLSLHYFSKEITQKIFKEIQRVLVSGGIVAVFVNSVNDPEFNTGVRLEQELFEIGGKVKRFFSTYSMDYFTRDFQVILLDDNGKTYKDEAKGVSNLIRFVGRNYPRRVNTNIALPFVSAIVERDNNGVTEVLVQTRWRPNAKWNYHNKIEIPAGVLDKKYENVIDAIKREVKEESGLTVTKIKNLDKTEEYSPNKDSSFAFKPFACSQQLKAGLPWVGFYFICEVKDEEPKHQEHETRNVRWVKKNDLRDMFIRDKEQFFTLHLGVLEYYFDL